MLTRQLHVRCASVALYWKPLRESNPSRLLCRQPRSSEQGTTFYYGCRGGSRTHYTRLMRPSPLPNALQIWRKGRESNPLSAVLETGQRPALPLVEARTIPILDVPTRHDTPKGLPPIPSTHQMHIWLSTNRLPTALMPVPGCFAPANSR